MLARVSTKLSRAQVTEGKITLNVRRKSRRNRFGFELARIAVIGSQLYYESETFSDYSLHHIFGLEKF